MNFYPHHIGDYRSATVHLSNEEDLAYRRLIEMYYDTESYIPLDTQWVSRRLRLGCDVVQVVLNDFFFMTEEGYRHARCDLEIREYNIKADIARQNGRKGGRRKVATDKAKNPAGSNPVSTGLAKRTQALANQYPVSSIQEPYKQSTEVSAQVSAGFASFWESWPSNGRKQAKGKCLDAWKKANAERDAALVIAHVESLKNSREWQKNGGDFIPAPLVYLNQRRWEGAETSVSVSGGIFAGAI